MSEELIVSQEDSLMGMPLLTTDDSEEEKVISERTECPTFIISYSKYLQACESLKLHDKKYKLSNKNWFDSLLQMLNTMIGKILIGIIICALMYFVGWPLLKVKIGLK